MLIIAFKPGHDGGIVAVENGRLLYSLESEKDSFARYSYLTPETVLEIAERLDRLPDVIAVGGRLRVGEARFGIQNEINAGYYGAEQMITRPSRFFGKDVTFFSSSHERSHIMGAIGMAPPQRHRFQVVLVWEGVTGAFFLVDHGYRVVKKFEVMELPGAKYAALFAILVSRTGNSLSMWIVGSPGGADGSAGGRGGVDRRGAADAGAVGSAGE
ncbi:hypothetical protein AB4Z47_19225, partial [Nocardia sp. 2TAF39]